MFQSHDFLIILIPPSLGEINSLPTYLIFFPEIVSPVSRENIRRDNGDVSRLVK